MTARRSARRTVAAAPVIAPDASTPAADAIAAALAAATPAVTPADAIAAVDTVLAALDSTPADALPTTVAADALTPDAHAALAALAAAATPAAPVATPAVTPAADAPPPLPLPSADAPPPRANFARTDSTGALLLSGHAVNAESSYNRGGDTLFADGFALPVADRRAALLLSAAALVACGAVDASTFTVALPDLSGRTFGDAVAASYRGTHYRTRRQNVSDCDSRDAAANLARRILFACGFASLARGVSSSCGSRAASLERCTVAALAVNAALAAPPVTATPPVVKHPVA